MDKLPNEILNKIFMSLPINQKQEYLSVCKKWEDVIRNQSLFHKVHINLYSDQCKHFIRLVKTRPELALQVQELTFNADLCYEYELVDFLCLFPNLKVVKDLSHQLINCGEGNQIMNIKINHRWQCYNGYASASMSSWILKYPSTLVSLILKAYHEDNLLDNRIITLLKNAPLLNHLCFTKFYITMDQLEAIHNNTPALKSLELRDCLLLSLPDTTIINFTPADNITTLNFHEIRISKNSDTKWNQYIRKKYPNIKTCDLNISIPRDRVSKRRPLFSSDCFTLQTRIFSSIELICNDRIYQFETIFDILDLCPNQKIKIKMYNPTANCLECLSECEMSENIEKLEFYDLRERVQLGAWTKKMKSLKSVKFGSDIIHPDDFRFKLIQTTGIDLINRLPFSLNKTNIEYDIFSTIEGLDLEYRKDWLSALQAYIDMCLPNLHKLKLVVFNEENFDPIEISLKFPRHRFTLIDIGTYCTYSYPGVKVVTRKKTMFFADGHSRTDYSLLGQEWTQVSEDKVPNIWLTVLCDSLEKLYFKSRPVLN